MKKYFLTVFAFLFLFSATAQAAEFGLKDGSYDVTLSLEGGSGKAYVESESTVTVEDGEALVEVVWSSPNYDYMIVDGQTYYPVNTEGNSVFEIPVLELNKGFTVIGDTVAMSTPHEIEYTLTVNLDMSDVRKTVSYITAAILVVLIVLWQYKRAKKNFNIGSKEDK